MMVISCYTRFIQGNRKKRAVQQIVLRYVELKFRRVNGSCRHVR